MNDDVIGCNYLRSDIWGHVTGRWLEVWTRHQGAFLLYKESLRPTQWLSWDDVQIQDLGLEVKNFSLEESQEGGLPHCAQADTEHAD